jgi:hypothetical protein
MLATPHQLPEQENLRAMQPELLVFLVFKYSKRMVINE